MEVRKVNNDLPEGWVIKPIGEVCQFEKGKKPKNTGNRSDARTIPYINIKAFESGMPEEYAEQGNCPICSKDDVLIVWDGARSGLVGKGVSGYIGSTLSKVWSELTDDKYLFYFLKSQYGYINTNTKGVGIPHVDPNILYAIQLPIAPFPIQTLIVSEIEKQFSRLDEAVAVLKRVQAGLKRYKASVLKAAVEGKLTEEWRKQNPNVEPADKLLKRILAERKKKWEEKNPAKKYKEPSAPDMSNLPQLPKGWVWATVDNVCSVISGEAFKKKDYVTDGIRLFQIANVSFGRVVWDQKNYLPNKFLESFPDLELKEGDVVMALNRPILDNMLKVARLGRKDAPAILYQRVAKFNFIVNDLASYFYVFAQSPIFLKQVQHNLQGTDQPYLNTSLIPIMIMPFPPLLEQQKIVEEIESRLSVAEEMEETININLKRAESLRQAILKKAFSGRLITQKE